MDGFRLDARLLRHAFGGASGRRAEQDFHALGGEDAQDSVEQRRLADSGPAGDHHEFRLQRHPDRSALGGGEDLAGPLLDPRDRLFGVDRRP